MKKLGVLLYSVILVLTSFIVIINVEAAENDNNIILDYQFETPTVSTKTVQGNIYDEINIENIPSGGKTGEPRLPMKHACILIPQGKMVTNITATYTSMTYLGAGFNIEPVGKPIPLLENVSESIPIADNSIYDSGQQFPGTFYSKVGTYWKKGYQILVLKLHPIQYIPSTGELYYYHNLLVSIDSVESEESDNILYRGIEKDKTDILSMIDNPDIILSYDHQSSNLSTSKGYDLLIFTTESLKEKFNELKNVHNKQGVATLVKTLSDVGSNDPELIREYLKEMYITKGIDYVLIGGDVDRIPAKMLWVSGEDAGDIYETFMPSDMYYGCLDGSFNYDEDQYCGEPTDGENGGDVDLLAELYIGRAPVSTSKEAYRFVSKTIAYLNTDRDDEYLEEALFVGEWLGFGGEAEWGGNHLDELVDECDRYNYTTTGIPLSQYDVHTLYDRDWGRNGWPRLVLINRINTYNPHLILSDGHGLKNQAMKLKNLHVYGLINTNPFFVYSTGCESGHFDGILDCFAEYVTIKTDFAGFAAVMNARYGWGEYNSTDGASQRFHREFWDAIFGEGKSELGRANQDSKEDNLWRIDQGCMRYIYYGLNLFGDPSIDILDHNMDNDSSVENTNNESTMDDIVYSWDTNGDTIVDQQTSFYPSTTPLSILPTELLKKIRTTMTVKNETGAVVTCKWEDFDASLRVDSPSFLNEDITSLNLGNDAIVSGETNNTSLQQSSSGSSENDTNDLKLTNSESKITSIYKFLE